MRVKVKYENIERDYIRKLLELRGIKDIESFLEPSKKLLNDPSKLSYIEKARLLLEEKYKEDSQVLLVIDSDADGYCSAAIMYQYLKEVNSDVNIDYVCHEGKQHGLEDIHKRLDLHSYDLVIVPDAGTNDGIICALYPTTSFLIIDHHEASDGDWIQPENMIIVNNQMSSGYPNKNLCGGGMTWQFVRYLSKFSGIDVDKYLDLAAVATVGDLMNSTQPENRYIIREGLSNLQNPLLIELTKLRPDKVGNLDDITQYRIGWYITPLINGMCRSGRYDEKIRMFEGFVDGDTLIQDTKRGAAEGEMVTRAKTAAREASNAKSRQDSKRKKMTELIEIMMESQDLLDNKILIFELDEDFADMPSELNGLIANQLARKYNRPALIVRENENGFLRGSARGVDTIDMPGLKDFFMNSGYFEYARGHQNAHGVSIHWGQSYGADIISTCIGTLFGNKIASVIITVSITLFALSTLLTWSLYGIRCYEYIFGQKTVKMYQIIFILSIIIGACLKLDIVWTIAEILNGFMAIPNLIAIIGLSPIVIKMTRDYFEK